MNNKITPEVAVWLANNDMLGEVAKMSPVEQIQELDLIDLQQAEDNI